MALIQPLVLYSQSNSIIKFLVLQCFLLFKFLLFAVQQLLTVRLSVFVHLQKLVIIELLGFDNLLQCIELNYSCYLSLIHFSFLLFISGNSDH